MLLERGPRGCTLTNTNGAPRTTRDVQLHFPKSIVQTNLSLTLLPSATLALPSTHSLALLYHDTTWAVRPSSHCTQGWFWCSDPQCSALSQPQENCSPPFLHTQTQLGLSIYLSGLSYPQRGGSSRPRAGFPPGTGKQEFQHPVSR